MAHDGGVKPDARLIRTVRFEAAHHYTRRDWTPERNAEVFGETSRPHRHTWEVTVRVVGPLDPETGFVVDLGELDASLEKLVGPWRGADLNDVIDEVRSGFIQPATESLARWIYERLAEWIPPPARLESVRVAEGPDLAGEYPAA